MSCRKYPHKSARKLKLVDRNQIAKVSIKLHEKSFKKNITVFMVQKINWNHYCVKVLASDNMNHIRFESNTV